MRGLTEIAARAGRAFGWRPARTAALATALTLLAIAVDARTLRYVYRPKQDFAGARDFVNASRQPGDAVVTVGVATSTFRTYFESGWHSAETADEVGALRVASQRLWLLYTRPIEMEAEHADIMDLVQRDFRLIREFDGSLNGGTIFVYRAYGQAASGGLAIRHSDRN